MGIEVSPTLIFEYSTAGAIAAHLRSALQQSGGGAAHADGAVAGASDAGGRLALTGLSAMLPGGVVSTRRRANVIAQVSTRSARAHR